MTGIVGALSGGASVSDCGGISYEFDGILMVLAPSLVGWTMREPQFAQNVIPSSISASQTGHFMYLLLGSAVPFVTYTIASATLFQGFSK
ncbi:MAG: hypothetical protein HC828_08325 [Blastochloris sp.]|nr:hypothetical protein [Blastochloris sp.]